MNRLLMWKVKSTLVTEGDKRTNTIRSLAITTTKNNSTQHMCRQAKRVETIGT